MKKLVRFAATLAILAALLPANLQALGGIIDSPVIVVPKPVKHGAERSMRFASPEEFQTRLFREFERPFVTGYFINQMSWLYFTGNARMLNRMLAELSGAEGVEFGIRFSNWPMVIALPFGEEDTDSELKATSAQWIVHHDASENRIWITIHVGKNGIDLEKLKLPVSKSLGEPAGFASVE